MSKDGSIGYESYGSIKLSPYHLKAGEPHPEEWTLVSVHKMERREAFQAWHDDLQANILSCARQINNLLERFPHPHAQLSRDGIMYSNYVIESETDRVLQEINSRHEPNLNPIFSKLHNNEDIRLYKGL